MVANGWQAAGHQGGKAPGAWIATLADPDDNDLQLVSPMEMSD